MSGTTGVVGLAVLGVVVAGAAGLWLLDAPGEERPPSADAAELVVHQRPGCGCCRAWSDYMREAGFRVRVEHRPEMSAVKRERGVPASLFSCHTAVLGDVVVEGHVPASTLRRYLAAGAPGRGLSVPGMQVGSPGMPGGRLPSFAVFSFGGGHTEVFERWRP